MESFEIYKLYDNYNSLKSDYIFLDGINIENEKDFFLNKKKILKILNLTLFDSNKDSEDKDKSTTKTGNIIRLNSQVKKINKTKLYGRIIKKKSELLKGINHYKKIIDGLVVNNTCYKQEIKEEN